MGVRGLESFLLQKHKQACPRVRLEALVEEYRRETGRTEAIAIIDTNILIRQCLEDSDVICGGQFLEYQQNLLQYVKRLTDLGISPVFFLDGSIDVGKMRCWLERKDETHNRIALIYRQIDEGTNTCSQKVEDCVLPAGIYECTILTLKKANFPVICAVSESDVEIARYARERKCFAILSRDTDFVILEGARFYLSLFHRHFDAREMSTILFDREAISRTLRIPPPALPLLASLLHNDYVDSSYLMPLYSKILGRRRAELQPDEFYALEELVPCLVDIIRRDIGQQEDPVNSILDRTFNGYPPFLLKNLARRLGLRDQYEMKEKLRQQLEVSLAMHEYTPPAPPGQPLRTATSPEPEPDVDVDVEVLELARARHRSTAFLNSSVLTLLTKRAIQMGPALEDPRLPATRTAETALRPFRRRAYGLLQVQGPFTEWVVPARPPEAGKKHEPRVVEPVVPDPVVHPHPGLLALWTVEDDDEDVVVDQWRLLAWALAAHRAPSAAVDTLAGVLRALPKHLVVPAAIVYLLYHSGALFGLEVPAVELVRLLTRTCLAVPQLTLPQLTALEVRRYDRLEVHIAALFMRAFTWVTLVNDILGAPVPLTELHPALYFDGKLFHHIFQDEPLDPSLHVQFDLITEELIQATVCNEAVEICIEE